MLFMRVYVPPLPFSRWPSPRPGLLTTIFLIRILEIVHLGSGGLSNIMSRVRKPMTSMIILHEMNNLDGNQSPES